MSYLSVEDIHTYYGKSHVLQGVSFEVEEGDTIALLGRNGAGKTTTIRSIQGMVTPRHGDIRFKGASLIGQEPYEVSRAGIATVPEEKRVFTSLSVEDNIDIVSRGSAWTIDRLYDIFPNLAERSHRTADALSGGEQQMLAIARALATNPELLLLDEPSEGLAPIIIERLRDALAETIESQMTVLLTEQNVDFALAFADRVLVMGKGTVEWTGSVSEFEADDRIADEYLSVG